MAHKKMIKKNSIHMATPDTRDFIKPWFKFFSFKDGETKYYISAINYDGKTKAIDQFKDKEVFIYDRLYPEPQKRFFTVINIISDLSWHTNKITLVVPYFPFLRQDHDSVNTDPFKEHEGKTAWVSLRLLAQAGLSYLITLDGHSFKRPGVFTTYEKFRNFPIGKDGKEIPEFGIIPPTLKIVNLTMAPELKRKVNFLAKKQGYDEVLFISPDLGASYMTEINLRKTRGGDAKDGVVEISDMQSDITLDTIKGYDVICFIDDLVASGGTILDSVTHLREQGIEFLPFTNEFEHPPRNAVDLMLAVSRV